MHTNLKLLIFLLLISAASSIQGIGLNPIRPYYLNQGQLASYLFSISTQQQILTNAKIQIQFPNEFDHTYLAANLQCMASSDSYSWKNVNCTYYINTILVNLQTILNENTYILVSQPLNPLIYTMSSYFSICLMYGTAITNCDQQFGKVIFATPSLQTASTLTSPNVTSLTSSTAGQSSTYQFKFSFSESYSVGNTMRIKFPPGFSTTSNPICQMSGTYNQVIKTFVWPDNRSIQCQNINKTISTNQVLKIIGIYNPKYAGTFGNTLDGFILQILQGTTTIALQQVFIKMQVSINTGTINGTVIQANNFIQSKSKYTFNFNIQNSLVFGDYIQIIFGNTWTLYSGSCNVITGLTLGNNSLTCVNSSDSTYSYLTISNFVLASVSNQIVLSIQVGSPSTIGTSSIQIITGNSQGVMDQMTSSVSLNSTYGALSMLSINAITANSKIAVGATGPLQLTFFLNYELPQTNVLTFGMFYLYIYPQIPLPDPLINGVLKCYFYNDIPAKTCTWDTPVNETYTLVTIYTPQTTSFQYSQIPITITTEGAVNSSMIGITIADKVTRYTFQFSAYTQANATTPTQVYYTQYIADPILLTLTTYSLTNYINQPTHFRFQFVGPYDFTTITEDLRLKIQFLNTGAWANNLGYTSNIIYKNYPCVFAQNLGFNTVDYDSDIQCDLYTFLEGPQASLTDSSVNGPYVIVYGFNNSIIKNSNYRLQIGNFLIGGSANIAANIRFSIIQQTPDMLTKYVELYYKQYAAFTTSSLTKSTLSSSFTTSMNTSQISKSSVQTNTYTVSNNGFAIIYDYDQSSTQSMANTIFKCSTTNWCVSLGYPLNWIIQYNYQSSFPTTITSKYAFTNGIYAGTFSGLVKVFGTNMSIIYKANFAYTYTPNTLTNQLFWFQETYLYKAIEQYYDVQFNASTTLPSNCFIRLTLGTGFQFGATPYCSSSQLQLIDSNLGLLCIEQNSQTTLKIYNLNGITANNTYQIRLRIASQLSTTSGASYRPTITIKTYLNLNIDTSVVDELDNLALNSAYTNYYNSLIDFQVNNPRVINDIPKVQYVGKFQIDFTPSTSAVSTANTIQIILNNHPWNGGFWTTPNNALTDALVCLLNGGRVACTFTLSPLTITMNIQPAGLVQGSLNKIVLDTEYIASENGIKHPQHAGEYISNMYFYSISNTLIQSTSFIHRVKARNLQNFRVLSTCNDIGVQNMFRINIQINDSIQINSYTNSTVYSRIFIQFPTRDSLGNRLFADNLGGYSKNGQFVGCYFDTFDAASYVSAVTDLMKCRLILSQVYGDPVKVQIINHNYFSSSYPYMRVYIARIFNPTIAVTSVPISIRVQHVTAANNNVQDIYYDTYDCFMNSQTPAPYANTTTTDNWNTFPSGNPNDASYIQFYVQNMGGLGVSSSSPYYYAIDLTAAFQFQNRQNSPYQYCYSGYYYQCMFFPQINYFIIYVYSSAYYYVGLGITYPGAIPQVTTPMVARIWQNGRFTGYNIINFTPSTWQQMIGTIQSQSFGIVGSGSSAQIGRRRQQVQVTFYLQNYLPVGGTVQIVWPSSVPAAYPHCRSMTNLGSALTASSQSYNGQIGCMVQNTRNWVITSFQALNGGAKIVIVGHIDLPNSYGYLGSGQIITYNNTDSTNIRTNGFIIDYVNDGNFGIYVANSNSWNVDSQITVWQTLPLRTGYVGPLQFKFQLASTFNGPNGGKINVIVNKRSMMNIQSGFSYVNKKYVCKIIQLTTNQQTGCIVQTVTDNNTVNYQNIQFIIFTSSNLVSATKYKLSLTSQAGTQPQGLIFPTSPGRYQVSVSFDLTGSGTYSIYNNLYLEVYGTPFTTLSVQSMVTIPGDPNLIWFQLTPTTTILQSQQIVIQFPTISTAGMNLFANDLGTGISDGNWLPTDIIDGAFTNGFMNCTLFHGDQSHSKNARVVCGSFTSSITSSQLLFFAIKIYNPSNSNQASIPLFIYSQELGQMYKSNFNVVQNAVYLRTDVYTYNYQGDIYSQYQTLQTSGTYFDHITRNYWALNTNSYYVLFFNFPLRVNGKVTNGCTSPDYSLTYGNAYYHQNLWAIACSITGSTIQVMGTTNTTQGNTRNLRISGFYTPWYYLSSGQQVVTSYGYSFDNKITSRGLITDGYPNQNPKIGVSPTFTMTPLHQTSPMYLGSRDDYIFTVIYSTASLIDLSYTQKIAIIIPNSYSIDYQLVGQDCVQGVNSDIQVASCWMDTNSQVIWVKPVVKSSYTNNMKLIIQTRNLAIRNPVSNSSFNMNLFSVKYYSWQNATESSITFSPLSNNNYCFLMINNIASSTVSFSSNPSGYSTPTFDYLYYPHQRYYEETPFNSLSHRAPLQMLFIPHATFPTVTGSNLHTIQITYPSSFGDYAMFTLRDLQVFTPVCYLANYRISRCTINTASNYIVLNFQFGLTAQTKYQLKVSIIDPRNPDLNGFTSSAAVSNILVQYQISPSPTIYYMESDQFPTLSTLPSGINAGPFRSIIAGTVQYGHAIPSQINVVNLQLTFNRTDITGLVFQIPSFDASGNALYPSNFATAFFSLQNGATYPCGNHGLSAGGNVKCFILNGDNTQGGISTRIIMTDFTYVSQMNCRFLFYNPDQSGSTYPYFSVNVKAYGGTKSATNLWGNQYMGQWTFADIFQVVSSSTTASTTTYTRNVYRVPTQSPWRNSTTDYVFSRNQILNSGRMSIVQVTLYNTALSYTDKTICEATLGSGNDYDDMIQYTLVSGANTYKYAYFIRTWPSNTNVSYTLGTGWDLSYIKCRFFALSHIAYFFFADNSVQIATNQWSTSSSYYGSYGSITAPTVQYFDQTYRFTDGTQTYFILQLDFTQTLSSVSNFYFRNSDSMVLVISFLSNYWTSIDKCSILGGVTSSSPNQIITCNYASTNNLVISNIGNFIADPALAVSTNMRVKMMFRGTYLTQLDTSNAPNRYLNTYLYANYDAYSNSYQPVISAQSSILNNCYYANQYCYYAHAQTGGTSGTFLFNALTDTSLRVTFLPNGSPNFSTNPYYEHYFALDFGGFGFGSGCSISSIVAQISSSTTPGLGTNNTISVDSYSCSDHQLLFSWTSYRLFSDIWGGQGLAADNTWNNNQYIIFYIVVAPGSTKDLSVYHHEYLFMTGSYNYQYNFNGTYYYQIRGVAYLPIQSLASAATLSTISTNRGGVTQLMVELKSLTTNIGSANTNYLLLAQFLGTSSWTSASDPFKSYTNTLNNVQPIDCKCLTGIDPLSSSTTSPIFNAVCSRRLPTASFNNFAILIDFAAQVNNDVRCYFPQFLITAGMSFNVQFKVIYGDSYPPDLIGSNYYGSMLRVTSNTLTFTGSSPSIALSSFSTFSQATDIYSSTVTVGSQYSPIYTLNAAWSTAYSTPYIYLNYRKAGPIPVFSFCSDSTVYYQCRVYSTYVYLVVAQLKSTSVSSISMTQGIETLYYPPFQFSDSSLFGAIIYVGTGNWLYSGSLSRTQSKLAPISNNSFSIMSDKYGSTRYGYTTNILISMNTNGQTLYNYFLTGSQIQIAFSIPIQGTNCQIWVQNQPNVKLTCLVSAGLITVYSYISDYTTSNNIFVSLGITNPSTASTTFTMKMYSYYYSSSRNSLVISTSATYQIDNSYLSNTQLVKSRIIMYPFKARISTVPTSPLRFMISLTSSPGSITYSGNGLITITNTQFQYSTAYLCYFKQYQSYQNMDQQTQYSLYQASSCTSSSTTLSILPAKTLTMNPAYYYQLIVMPIGISSTGCSVPGYGCYTQTGFHQTNFQDINLVAYQYWVSGQTPTVANQQANKRYAYQGSTMIGLDYIYVLSVQPTYKTSLYIAFNLNFTSAYSYPGHYIQFIFWNLPASSFTGYSLGNIIPCQLSSNFQSIAARQSPQCRIGYMDTANNILKVKIQNIGPISVSNYWISLDDIILPSVLTGDLTQKFDVSIGFYIPSTNLKYQNNFKQIFLMTSNIGINPITSSTFTFSNPSVSNFGAQVSGQVSFNWPFSSLTSSYQSKIAININGGYAATWNSINNLTFSDVSAGTYLLLWVNQKLNKFVLQIPNKANGVATTMSINNIINPYPYQMANYDLNSTNIQINFYQSYYLQTHQIFSQPAFTYFQKNPSIIFINQNIPTNTLDNYVSQLKTAPGGYNKLILSVQFDETQNNIILRQINLIDITFTSGLTYVDTCRVVRNSSLYVNTYTACQTYYDSSNWHVKIYEVSSSMMDVGWWIEIWGTFSSATLSYKFQAMPYNLAVQYQTNYTTSISNFYSSSNSIPTVLSWMNNKYVANFYQTQVKLLQANSGVTTPHFRFRFTVPASYDGWYGDYINIQLPSNAASQPFKAVHYSSNPTGNHICNFLPATSVQRDFSIGLYSECVLHDTGSYLYYQVTFLRGGLTQGQDYLLQITQPNIITSSFYLPSTPQRDLITLYLWRNQSSTAYSNSDAFFIQTYRYFTQATIVHTTATVSNYDTLTITYTPQGSFSAGSSTREMVLRLSVNARYFNYDGGVQAIYTADNTTIQSGAQFSQWVSGSNGNQVATVQFAMYSIDMNPLRYSLAKQNGYTSGTQYTWIIPLLQNPSVAYTALRYNLTLVQYDSSTYYQIILNHYEIINEYYTVSDTSSSLTTALINSQRNVQLTTGIDLAVDLSGYSLSQWNTAIFKLDNEEIGLISAFSSCNDTSNYNYFYFPYINMVMAQKKTVNSISTIGIGSFSGSNNYQATFSFSWVYIYSSSNVPTSTNPYTLKYSISPTLTLNYLSTFSSATLAVNQGIQMQGSQVMYTLTFTSPIIPFGAQIRIMFDNTIFTSNNLGDCRVGSGFVKSSNQNTPMICYRGSNGFVISGFSAISVSTSLTVYFYLKNVANSTATPIYVDIYGVYRDNTTRISYVSIKNLNYPSGTYPSTIYRNEYMIQYYYQSINSDNYYYEFQGSFIPRTAVLNNTSDGIYMTCPFTIYGNLRLTVKKNVSSVTGWTQLTYSSCSGTQCLFYLPQSYSIDLSLAQNQQYLFRYTSYNWANSGQNQGQQGFYIGASGSNRFEYVGYDGNGVGNSDLSYFQFIPSQRPKVLTINNLYPAAGHQTVLDLSFTVGVDINAGATINLYFDTNNLLLNMFANDLQGAIANVSQTYRYLDCRQWSSNYNISNQRLVCLLYFGNNLSVGAPTPSRMAINLGNYINGNPTYQTIRFMIANVQNPSTVGMNVGVKLNISSACQDVQNQQCPVYSAQGYYTTTSSSQNSPSGTATFSSSSNIVLASSLTHTFSIALASSINTNDVIFIVYPQNFAGVMPTTCYASGYTCYSFPTRRWISLYPLATYSGTISLGIYWMTNGYYSQPSSKYFKITIVRPGSLGDVYYITQPSFTPISSGISMSITATQTPQIWLRNYANTAIFEINNIFMDYRIQAIFIQAPSDVTVWTDNYCNATITGTLSNTYPLRFLCQVFPNNSQFLMITRQASQMTNYNNAWASSTITVHAQFTIADFSPGQPTLYVTMPVSSNSFNVYGSVSTTSESSIYYLSKTSQTIMISQNQVPIISDITFDQQSFALRVGTVNSKEVFYMLLRPIDIITPISKMVFTLPAEFNYPGVFTLDDCYILGRTKQAQNNCALSRYNGQTLVTLTPTNYDQQVKIIQLGASLQSNWFTSPTLPGDFYNMTVELYGTQNNLLQKQTINISPVYGEYFSIPSIYLYNIKQASLTQSLYDLQFVTGTLQIPPGGYTTATTQTSQLQFIFENYNSDISTDVFANDLKTGLSEGDQVGCVFSQGLNQLAGDRLRCVLHVGTNSTDKPTIRVLGYDFVNPATTINISFAGIQSLPATNVNTISIGVVIYYNDATNSSTYLYIPTPVITVPTNATSTQIDRTFNLSGWSWSFNSSFSGVNIVLQPTQFQFSMIIPYWGNYSGYRYSSTGTQDSFILIKFSPKYLIDPYNTVNISSPQCTKIQVFYATGIIRCQHTQSISGWNYWTWTFYNFPTSAYNVQGLTVDVAIQIYDKYRLVTSTHSSPNVLTRTVQKCTLFNFGVISVSSLNGGQIGVSYVFSIQTNHYIPQNGAVSISIPSSYGDMVANNAVCTLIGFSATNAYCQINTPSRVDIYLNGSLLDQSSIYTIQIDNIQNPNQDVSNQIFFVSSYFDHNIYKARKICQNQITSPKINVKAIRSCTISGQPNFANQMFNASYTFYIGCTDLFRGDSILYIQLPTQYNSQNNVGTIYCTSYQSTTLTSNLCSLKFINGSFYLIASLDATPQSSLSIIVNLINPTNNTYTFSAAVFSKGVLYASTTTSQTTILSDSYMIANSSNVFLLNNPRQAGLLSTYIFKVAPITTFDPQNMAITFPSSFSLDASKLTVGIACSSINNLFSSLNYNSIQQLVNNISAVAGVSLKYYPATSVTGNTIFLQGISGVLVSNQWTYLLIQGITNPSTFNYQNFTLEYYLSTDQYNSLTWYYSNPLTYYINPPPNYLSIDSVSVNDYDLLYPATYKFKISSTNNITIAGKTLSFVIVLPTFYSNTLWANVAPNCSFSILSNNSTCYSYQSQIIVTQTFATNLTSLTLTINNILNPSLPTTCNTTDVTLLSQTFFTIRIIDVSSDTFLFQSTSVVNGNNCLNFSSIRIPITLQYSLTMVAGIAYNITYSIAKPASNLKINAYIVNQTGFTFSPTIVEFNDYYTLSNSTTLYLRSDINPGTYTILFTKYQADLQTYFRNILPITITVISSSQSNIALPTISISSIVQSTIGYPVSIPVLFSLPSSTQMTLFMTIQQQATHSLAQYSPYFANFSLIPRIITILPQNTNYSLVVSQGLNQVPPPLTLTFNLTSLYPIIHNLTTPTMYLCFDQDPKYNVLYPPLRVRVTPYLSSCNTKDIGKNITNIFVTNGPNTLNSAINMNPIIISVQATSIYSTGANISVSSDSSSTIYYLCQNDGYPDITNQSLIRQSNASNMAGSTTSLPQTVYSGSVSQINYVGAFLITGLSSLTKYNLYVVLNSNLGYSNISKYSFTTIPLSNGVQMTLTFTDIVEPLAIVQALQRIMRISPLRIKVMTSNYNLQIIKNSVNSNQNAPKYPYQIVIAPDATNDIMTPLNLVQSFVNDSSNLQLLKTQIFQWDNTSKITYYELRVSKPKVTSMPQPVSIYNYNCTFSIKMWQQANIYAVLIQRSQKAPNTLLIADIPIVPVLVSTLNATAILNVPSSNQIRNGTDNKNNPLSKYRKFYALTDANGNGLIFFDDLTPGSIYDMYITASSILPYSPTYLWADNQVITLKLTVMYNLALQNQPINTEELRKYKPGLADAIDNYLSKQQRKSQLQR